MDQSKRVEVIKRQDADSRTLAEKRERFYDAQDKWFEYFRKVDNNDANIFGLQSDKRSDVFKNVIDLFLNNPESYNQKKKEIDSKYPWFKSKEFKDALVEMRKNQYDYYDAFVKYLNMVNNDYNMLFTEAYKKRTFDLANHGVFLFYEQTPDLEEFLIDNVEENKKIVLHLLSMDNYKPLLNMLSGFLFEDDPNDYLRTIKTNELREAIFCLINGCYSSCTRTMLALIENEHTNASNINKDLFKDRVTKGHERSIEISKQLGEVNISYFSRCWELMNSFYKEITLNNNKKSNRFINRNEVVHGVYLDSILPNEETCVSLILFYMSFKAISFYLQEIYEMKTSIMEDALAIMARKAKNNV